MLKISSDQLSHLSRTLEAKFLNRMMAILESEFPFAIPAGEQEAWAERIIARAKELGYREASEIEGWLRLNAQLGESFTELPWARRILSDRVLDARERLHLLKRRAVFATRQAKPERSPRYAA